MYYKSLTKDEMRKIVDLQLNDLRKRMDEGKHLKLEVTTAAKDFIIDSAYDSVYGARPIKRFIQSRVETLIAKAIIQGSYAEGSYPDGGLRRQCPGPALSRRKERLFANILPDFVLWPGGNACAGGQNMIS